MKMEYSKLETVDTFNLFEVGPMIAPAVNKPRQASEQECKVYAQWLALKSGLLVASNYFPKLEWKQSGRTRNDRVCIGAYFDDQFIAFPGADQNGAVEFEILGDDGEPVSSTTLYKKTKGAGALQFLKTDIAAIKKAAKEPAPVAAEIESEPAPIVDTVPAAPALVAEYDAPATPSEATETESQPEPVTERESEAPAMVEAAPVEIDAPSEPEQEIEVIEPAAFTLSGTIRATMPRGGAWDWSRGYQGNEQSPSEAIAPAARDDRPRRLRIVRAYLRMRKERAAFRAQIELGMSQLENANRCREEERRAAAYWDRKSHANLEKRRRAVLNAKRHWQMRLQARFQYQEEERYCAIERKARTRNAKNGRHLTIWARSERDKARAELAKLKANRADPSNPERASDLMKLKDERDQARGKLETVTNERDRLKASIEASAGTLDEMIDRAFRAEAELRDVKAPRGYHMSAPVIAFRQAA
jgi:hypothetical protein